VAVSEDVQNCADEGTKSMEEWDSQRIPNGKCLEMPELLVFMKVQTKSTECYL
jgi:hypothetical protein